MKIFPDIYCHSTNCLHPNVGLKARLKEIVLGSNTLYCNYKKHVNSGKTSLDLAISFFFKF